MLQPDHKLYPQFLPLNYCLLAWLAGTVAVRFWAQGLLALVLLLFLGNTRAKRPALCLGLCFSFICALGYAQWRSPVPPEEPLWLEYCLGGESSYERPRAVYVTGLVTGVEVLPDSRLRLQVKDIRPVPPRLSPKEVSGQYAKFPPEMAAVLQQARPYPGQVTVTLRQVESVPLPGQRVHFNGRFARVRGFANPGVVTVDDYWHDRGIWIRGWNVVNKRSPGVSVTGEPYFWTGLRHTLWEGFIKALPAVRHAGASEKTVLLSDIKVYQGTGQAFLPALVFGDRSGMSPEQTELLSKSTLTHSISLSGLHLTYVGFIGLALASVSGRIFPQLFLFLPRLKVCFLLTVPLALIYLWIGGAPLSLTRSALMLFFSGLVLFFNRAQILFDALCMAVFLIIMVWPWAIFDIGLQLSALSVAAIAFFYPVIGLCTSAILPVSATDSQSFFIKNRLRAGLSLLCMSLCIQAALAPLLLQVFGSVGVWFPLNLVWLPVLGIVVMPLAFAGFLAAGLGWNAVAQWALMLAQFPCQLLMDGLRWMDSSGYLAAPLMMRPHWPVIVALWVVLVSLPLLVWHMFQWARQKKPFGRQSLMAAVFCAAGCALAAGISFQSYIRYGRQDISLSMLDVGQGQALVVAWPGGRALIDGGGFANSSFDVGRMVIAPYLTDQKPAEVDWLINSHPDFDHLGGMIHIYERFTVKNGFAYNGDTVIPSLREDFDSISSRKAAQTRQIWHRGQNVTLAEGLILEVLWPPKEGGYTGNDASLVLRLVWKSSLQGAGTQAQPGRGLALLCGDIGANAVRQLLSSTGSEALQAEVLVLPHHGSKTGFHAGFYEAIAPATVLVSCGYKNTWRFPSKTIVEVLANKGIPLYSTAENGWIRVSWPDASLLGLIETARSLPD